MADSYFAAAKRADIGAKLYTKVENYGQAGSVTSSINSRLRLAYQYYFGLDPSGVHATSQVLRAGDQGELAKVRVNHSRALVNTLVSLIIGPKLVWQPKATNRDFDSIRETRLAAAVLEYYWSEKGLSRYAIQALEEAVVFAEGFVHICWDGDAGEESMVAPPDAPPEPLAAPEPDAFDADPTEAFAPPTEPAAPAPLQFGKLLKTGDIRYECVSSWDVIRDATKKSYDELDWVIVRFWKNKFELAAKYPDQTNDILRATDADGRGSVSGGVAPQSDDEQDLVACYYFYHRQTMAMPDGRQTVFLSSKVVLDDGPLKYDEIPLYRVAPAELISTPYGYTPYFETLGIQELMDSLESSIASNQTTFATQNIAISHGTDIDDISGGMRAFYIGPDGQMPQALQLCRTPSEVFSHLETKKRDQEAIMGLNSVVRGMVPGNPKEISGAALALLQSQALQQSSVLQGNYTRLIERLGLATVRILQKFADAPLKIDLVGKHSEYLVDETSVTGSSLNRIKKVQVEIGNPMSQTAAGRLELAKLYLSTPGMAEKLTPEQLEQVATTGRIESLTHSIQDELMLVLSENEDIAQGVTPEALVHDDAILHCREHRSTLATPNARKNPKVLKAAMDHIHKHYAIYFGIPLMPPTTNPMTGEVVDDPYVAVLQDPFYRDRMLFLMGLPPAPPDPMAMMGGMPPPGAPPPGAPPGAPPNGGGPGPDGGAPPPKPAGLPNGPSSAKMPGPPTNPATNTKWDPVTGGGVTNHPAS